MLGKQDFLEAYPDKPLLIPESVFARPKDLANTWPDYPDLRTAVNWLKTFLPESEWRKRRDMAFRRLLEPAYGLPPRDGKGRFFDATDTFGWYLFLADAFLDHPWNYEPMFGSRVVPVMAAIGRDLDRLRTVNGVDTRVRRLVGSERSQPNGGFFELLVAAAYCRAGAKVAFLPEKRGHSKTHDMDVVLRGKTLAVECKRLETGEYGELERARMRELWGTVPEQFVELERSIFGEVDFFTPVLDAPVDYLTTKARELIDSGLNSLEWTDHFAKGILRDLDLKPLQDVLKSDEILTSSTRILELLSGEYVRHANYLQAIRCRAGMTPRYICECDRAVLLRWKSTSPTAIGAKARDVMKRLSEGNKQIPADQPGIIHIGFEAVEGDDVEQARYNKILASMRTFDSEGKQLEFVYCHYLVPESPPDEAWAFDETVQWCRIKGHSQRPLEHGFLIIPDEEGSRKGPHWQK